MKGLVYEEYAPDDDYKKILKVKDVDDPKPKSDEVVFNVKAAALNFNDADRGLYFFFCTPTATA